MKERKTLRLSGFDYRKEGAYFVTICTQNRMHCLSKIVGADAHIGPHAVLSEWGKIVERYLQAIPGVDIYVIMPNHVHLIVWIGSENGPMWASAPTQSLSERIRSFKILATKQIGQPIWQRSFYDRVLRGEEEYLRVCKYITDNPARWTEDEYYYPE